MVTDVLCMNFPDLPTETLASLSERLEQWSREYAAKPNVPVCHAETKPQPKQRTP